MKKYLIAFLLCVIGMTSHCEQTSFSSLDEAVKPALLISKLRSSTNEYGGILYTYRFGQTKYYYSEPKTDNAIDWVVIRFEDLPQGAVLAGFYHTHPCTPGYLPQRFSHNDVALMIHKKVPMYVLDMCSNKIRKLDWLEYIEYIHGTEVK